MYANQCNIWYIYSRHRKTLQGGIIMLLIIFLLIIAGAMLLYGILNCFDKAEIKHPLRVALIILYIASLPFQLLLVIARKSK